MAKIGTEVRDKETKEYLGDIVNNSYNKLTIHNKKTDEEIQKIKWNVEETEKIHVL